MLKRKDLLGLKDITAEEMEEILSTAVQMRKILDQNVKKTPHLQGKSVTTLFYENSTRTRTSFETAAKIMGANTTSISAQTSSVTKGETLIDTGKNLDALLTDVIIMRHSMSGAPHLLAKNVKASVINAGDGMNEHPSQALLDALTAQRHFGDLSGLKLVIVGDIKHSRVARSDALVFTRLGASVTVCGPYTLIPDGIESFGVTVDTDLENAVAGANIIMPLRLQTERMNQAYIPSVEEFHMYYGVGLKHLAMAADDAVVMHPAPINRGAEISGDVADCDRSLIQEQVKNGVAVRMAMLYLLLQGGAK